MKDLVASRCMYGLASVRRNRWHVWAASGPHKIGHELAQIRVFWGLVPPRQLNVKDYFLIVSLLLFKKLIVVLLLLFNTSTVFSA